MGSKLSSSNRENYKRGAVGNHIPLSVWRRCLLKRKNLHVLALIQIYRLKAYKNSKTNFIQLEDIS